MAASSSAVIGDNYVLSTGDSGADRLRLLDEVYGAATRQMLLDAGLKPGMRVLDMACGVGTVSCWMAKIVGPAGSVVAADVSPAQLAVARAAWEACEDLEPVEFVEASAYETGMPAESFDLVHCRALLCHLERPIDAIREFYRLLRQGGVFACHDLYFSGMFTVPASPAYRRSMEITHALGKAIGVNYDSGLLLPASALEVGFQPPTVRMEMPVYLRGPGKRMWEHTFAEASAAAIREGLTTKEEVAGLLAEMETFARDESVLICQYPFMGVWAVK